MKTLLILTSTLTIAISANVCWIFQLVNSNIILPLIDTLLIFIILYSYFFIRKKEKIRRKAKPPKPTVLPKPSKNKFIMYWKSKHLRDSYGNLPLDRLAYLKARYKIGPFRRYPSELTLSYLKNRAESTGKFSDISPDEVHPKILMSAYTHKYIQFRALLYRLQEIQNVDFPYQFTLPNTAAAESSSSDMERRMTMIPSTLSEEQLLNENDMMRVYFEESEEETRKRREFRREMEKARKKLENVENVFSMMRQTDKDNKVSENNMDDSKSALKRLFVCSHKKSSDEKK